MVDRWQLIASSGKQWQAVASSGKQRQAVVASSCKQWQAVGSSGKQWQAVASRGGHGAQWQQRTHASLPGGLALRGGPLQRSLLLPRRILALLLEELRELPRTLEGTRQQSVALRVMQERLAELRELWKSARPCGGAPCVGADVKGVAEAVGGPTWVRRERSSSDCSTSQAMATSVSFLRTCHRNWRRSVVVNDSRWLRVGRPACR